MAVEHMTSQLVEVRNELEIGMDADPVAESRMQVVKNVVGQWVLRGTQLPDALDVPALTYTSIDELVQPCPTDYAGIIYHGYTDELTRAATTVLGQFDVNTELDVLVSGTVHAVTHEASQRLGSFADILLAIEKPQDNVLELLEVALLEQDRVADDLRKTMARTEVTGRDATALLRKRATYLTRLLINYERDAAYDVITDRLPSSAFIAPLNKSPVGGLRGKLRRMLALN